MAKILTPAAPAKVPAKPQPATAAPKAAPAAPKAPRAKHAMTIGKPSAAGTYTLAQVQAAALRPGPNAATLANVRPGTVRAAIMETIAKAATVNMALQSTVPAAKAAQPHKISMVDIYFAVGNGIVELVVK